jgi:hypothetical protein
MQQMLQKLRARMDVWGKEMNINQEKTEANAKVNQEDWLARMKEMDAKMDANQVKADGKLEEMLARIREEIKSGQAEMTSTLDEWLMDLKDCRKETTACQEATETEPDPRMMQSIEGILEEVCCRLQEGVPQCKSGMVKKEPLQECSDPNE